MDNPFLRWGDFAFGGCKKTELFQCREMTSVISDTEFFGGNRKTFMQVGGDNYASRYAAKMKFDHGYTPPRRSSRIYW